MIGPRPARREWLLAAALSCACSVAPTGAELEGSVHRYFAERDIVPQAVACPAVEGLQVGEGLRCTATIDGQPLVVAVDRDEQGTTIRPERETLRTAEIEPEIAEQLRGQGYAVTTVRCEGQVWVVAPQAEHRCVVEVTGGQRYGWRGVFSGQGAEHRAFVTLLQADGGAREDPA